MTTITIEITDEQARQLSEEASRLNVTPEDLAARNLMESLGASEPNFRDISQQVIEENAELYRRLA